jgi:hypothetical protein
MWRMCMSVLVSGWLLTTPALWAHRWEQAAMAVLVGALGFIVGPAVVAWPRFRPALAWLGAALALATFAFPDGLVTTVDNLVCGVLLVIGGYAPEMVVHVPARQVERTPEEKEWPHRAAA